MSANPSDPRKDTLFMMPHWYVCSETWMKRMVAGLHERIATVATLDAERVWPHYDIPGLRLTPQGNWRIASVLAAGGNRISSGYQLRTQRRAMNRLLRLIAAAGIRHVVCNYLDFALQWHPRLSIVDMNWVVHCHGADVAWEGCRSKPPFARLHDTENVRKAVELAEHVSYIANSSYTREQLLSIGIPDEAIFVKYFGVDAQDHERARKPDKLTVLYLGRLVDWKGPDRTVSAFLRAVQLGFEGTLIMAGDGPMRVACELLARQSEYRDRITFLGAVSPVRAEELMRQADIFSQHNCRGVITQREEAFGVSLIEAMSFGLPVVTGRSGGVPESVVDGVTGCLVAPNDIEAHARCLLRLQDPDLRYRLGSGGRSRVREHFSTAAEAQRLSEILEMSRERHSQDH